LVVYLQLLSCLPKVFILIAKHLLFVFLCFLSISLFAQPTTQKKITAEEAYQKRIIQQNLGGVYIPKDLSDAFVQFNKLIEKPTIEKFRSLPEEEADRRLHNGFGKWISFNYSFYEGSRFSVYLNKLGLYDPDDMITFVITTYHRNLNKKKLDVKPLSRGSSRFFTGQAVVFSIFWACPDFPPSLGTKPHQVRLCITPHSLRCFAMRHPNPRTPE